MITPSSTLTIDPSNYDGLQVSWTLPTGNWNEQVLLRSSFGTPTSVSDAYGVTVLDQLAQATPQSWTLSYLDTGLKPGHFYYYALYVFDTDSNTYLLAGAAQGLVISYYGFDQLMYSWLPDWYLEQDVLQPGQPLQQFMALLGYEMDWLRSEIESFFLFSDINAVSGALLPYLAGNFGMTYEPEIGMARSRVLVGNAVYLYKTRGTVTGIQAAASAFTGYAAAVTYSRNIEIQLDDTAFDRSVGHWVSMNGVTTLTTATATAVAVLPPHTAYNPVPALFTGSSATPETVEGYLPVNNENVLELGGSGAIVDIAIGDSTATATLLGIPCVPGEVVVLSGYIYPLSTTRSFFMQIDWYNTQGAFLSSSTGASVAEVASKWVRPYVVATAPAGAAYYARRLKSTATLSADLHLFDAEQVEVSTQATPGPTAWQPPRDIQINLLPVRQNLVANPQGKVGITGWSASGGLIAASASMATPPAISWPGGATAGFVVTAEPGSVGVSGPAMYGAINPGSSWFGAGVLGGTLTSPGSVSVFFTSPVNPGVPYSLSVYMRAATTARPIQLSVSYFDALGNPLSPSVFTAQLAALQVPTAAPPGVSLPATTPGLLLGYTYQSLVLASPISPSAVVQNEEALIINPGASDQQLIHTSAAVAGGVSTIPVGAFLPADNYPAGTSIAFAYVRFTDTVGSFTRGFSINLVTPPKAATAQVVLSILGSPVVNEIHYIGAPLFEPLSYLLPFFDGSFSPSSDYSWEGTPNNSVSDYYPALTAKLSRLITAMPDYIPMGATFSIFVGAQALAAAGLNG